MENDELFDINKFDIDNDKHYAISASAGTGKTYNIVEIVKKLIDKNVELKNLLIVTYTDKAAGELKDRIRKAVKGKGLNVDDAFIGTIHSFCKSTIEEFGLSAGLPLNLNLIDETAFDSFLDEYVRCGSIFYELPFIVTHDDVTVDKVKKYLKEAIKKYYLDSNGEENKEIVSFEINKEEVDNYEYFNGLNSFNSIEELEGNKVYNEIYINYKILKDSSYIKANLFAKNMNDNIHNKFKQTTNDDGEKCTKSTFGGKTYNQECKAYTFLTSLKKKKYDVLHVVLYKYLKDLYLKWNDYKSKNKLQTFDDMIRNVLESINKENSILLTNLKKKYKYGIIDEFQDTNQKQYIIFKKMFLEDDEHHLIVVGDEKQSIYSFQGADVAVFEKAIEEIKKKGGKKTFLTKNYRSSKKMVESCNKLFSDPKFGFGGKFENAVALEEKDKNGFLAKYEGKEIEHSFYINKDACSKSYYPELVVNKLIDLCSFNSDGKTKLQLFDKKKGNPEDVKFKNIAVLARTRSEMDYICKVFKRVGIPFIKYKDNSLYKSNECYHWITLLDAISKKDFTGNNRESFKKSLFTDFFGKSLIEILDPIYNTDDSDEMSLINEWQKLAYNYKWEELISSIIYQSSLINNLKYLSKIQSISIYKQIGDYCLSHLNKNNSLDLLIDSLKKLSKSVDEDSEDEDGGIIAKGTDFNAIQVMTIHASKGLEFDIVIIVAGYKDRNNQVPKIFFHRDEKDNKNPKIIFDKDIAEVDELNELRRLYYVAYTRAKYIAFLPNYSEYSKINSKGEEIFIQSGEIVAEPIRNLIKSGDFENIDGAIKTTKELKKAVKDILIKIKEINNKDKTIDDISTIEKNNKVLIKNRNNTLTYKHSYSSLAHSNEEDEVDEMIFEDENNDKERESEELNVLIDNKNIIRIGNNFDTNAANKDLTIIPKGMYSGNAIHELFETIDFKSNIDDIKNEEIEEVFNKQTISFKNKPDAYDQIRGILKDSLNATITEIIGSKEYKDKYFKLSSIPNEDKKAEIEFNFNMVDKNLSNYCNGFMDLVIKRGDIYSVLDYKTDSLSDEFKSFTNIKDLGDQVDRRYAVQRVLYSYTLIKYLSKLLNKSEEEIFNNNFGGVHYIFVRGTKENTGNGVYSHTWKSYNDLLNSYNEILSSSNIGVKNE